MLSICVQQFQFVGFARTAVNQVKRADIRLRQATAASSQGRVIKCHWAQLFFGQTREHFNLRLINCMRKHGTKTAKTKWNEKKGKKTFFKICNDVTKGKCCVGFDAAFSAPGASAPTLLQLPLLLLPSVVLPVFLLALKLIPLPQHLLAFSYSSCAYCLLSYTNCSASLFPYCCCHYFSYSCSCCSTALLVVIVASLGKVQFP